MSTSTNKISDGLLNPSTSSNSSSNSSTNSSTNSSNSSSTDSAKSSDASLGESISSTLSSSNTTSIFGFIQNMSVFTWILIIFLLAFFGFNIFNYLAQGTEQVNTIFKPLIDGILRLVAYISSIFVGVTASGTNTIVTGTSNAIGSGLTKIENRAAQVQEKTTPSSLKSEPVSSSSSIDKKSSMDNNSLNKSLNNAKASQEPNNDFEADNSGSVIQSGSSKAGWCYIGEDRGFRSCMEIGKSDKCMSGDIFPSKEICVNPNLRP